MYFDNACIRCAFLSCWDRFHKLPNLSRVNVRVYVAVVLQETFVCDSIFQLNWIILLYHGNWKQIKRLLTLGVRAVRGIRTPCYTPRCRSTQAFLEITEMLTAFSVEYYFGWKPPLNRVSRPRVYKTNRVRTVTGGPIFGLLANGRESIRGTQLPDRSYAAVMQ